MSKKKSNPNAHMRSTAKKPYLTKTEIAITVAIVVVIAAVVVCFNLFYDDGALKLVDNAVQTEGEYSLVVNGGQQKAPRYFKVGQTGEVEGYTLKSADPSGDANVTSYSYTADEGADLATSVSVSGSPQKLDNALSNAAYYRQMYMGALVGEVQEMQVGEHDAKYFIYTIDVSKVTEAAAEAAAEMVAGAEETTEEAPAEEAETEESAEEASEPLLTGIKGIDLAIKSGDRSVLISLNKSAYDGAELVPDETLLELARPFADVITYETK